MGGGRVLRLTSTVARDTLCDLLAFGGTQGEKQQKSSQLKFKHHNWTWAHTYRWFYFGPRRILTNYRNDS